MKFHIFLFTFVHFLSLSQSIRLIIDRRTNETIQHVWLEVGFVFMDDVDWLTITTKNDEFREDVVAFISLPDIGGSLYNQSIPLVPKLQKPPSKNEDGTWTFVAKLIQAEDSYCSTEWYTPIPIPLVQVSWLAVEKCLFDIAVFEDTTTDTFRQYQSMLVDTGNITRNNSATDLGDGATNGNGNFNRLWYPTGCEGDNEASCTLTNFAGRAHSDYPNYASLQQIQTSINKVPGNRPADANVDFFISVRSKIINSRHIQLVLSPHSSVDPQIYEIDTPEVVGYFIFPTELSMVCQENMIFETHVTQTVTSLAIEVPFNFHYDYPPGLFGMLGTTVSIVDSTTLRTFSRTNSSAFFITQEDQCTDEQTIHTTNEWAFTFVVGEQASSTSTARCYVKFNSALEPTPVPSTMPSFEPTFSPTVTPTVRPTVSPTVTPTARPTDSPTATPTVRPTVSPTVTPTVLPTVAPSASPSSTPTSSPSSQICVEGGHLKMGLFRRPVPQYSKTDSDILLTSLKGVDSNPASGTVKLETSGNNVSYNITLQGLEGCARTIRFYHADSDRFIHLVTVKDEDEGCVTFGSWTGAIVASDEAIDAFLNQNVAINVATVSSPSGDISGVFISQTTNTGTSIASATLSGEEGSSGSMSMRIDNNIVTFSLLISGIVGDLSFDEISSVYFQCRNESGPEVLTEILYYLDTSKLVYQAVGVSGDQFVLQAQALDVSFVTADDGLTCLANGLMSVHVTTKTYTSGVMTGSVAVQSMTTTASYILQSMLGGSSSSSAGLVQLVTSGNTVGYEISLQGLESCARTISFYFADSGELIHLINAEADGCVTSGTWSGSFIASDAAISAFLNQNVLLSVVTASSSSEGELSGMFTSLTTSAGSSLLTSTLSGEEGATGSLNLLIESNVVTFSILITGIVGDLNFDEIISVDLQYMIENETHTEFGLLHSMDISRLVYQVIGTSGDKYILQAQATDVSFVTTDAGIGYLTSGIVSVRVATRTYTSGVATGSVALTTTRTSYGVFKVMLTDNGVVDLRIMGNALSYHLNISNLTSPVHNIFIRYNNSKELIDQFPFPISTHENGYYSAVDWSSALLEDQKVAFIFSQNAIVELQSENSAQYNRSEGMGYISVLYIESKATSFALESRLSSATGSASWGDVTVQVMNNFVSYTFNMSGLFSSDESEQFDEITSIRFHYTVVNDDVRVTTYLHDVNTMAIAYSVVTFDEELGMYELSVNLTDTQRFRTSDGVIDMFAAGSVNVTVATKSYPSGELLGALLVV